MKKGSAGGEGRGAFSLCYSPEMGIAQARASQNPHRPALTSDAHPSPRDQQLGGLKRGSQPGWGSQWSKPVGGNGAGGLG